MICRPLACSGLVSHHSMIRAWASAAARSKALSSWTPRASSSVVWVTSWTKSARIGSGISAGSHSISKRLR
jgi:hypothetical protein